MEGRHGAVVSTCTSPTRSACRLHLERARDGALEGRYIRSRDRISELLGDLPDECDLARDLELLLLLLFEEHLMTEAIRGY